MQADLEKLKSGGSFDEFARCTRRQWQALAVKLMQRWPCPADVAVEDVVQEMYVGVWVMLPKYDPGRGKTLAQFVVWNAVNRAKKYIHRQRGALRRDDRAISRHPIAFAMLKPHSDPKHSPEEALEFDSDQEREAQKAQMLKRVCESPRVYEIGRLVMRNEGDVEAAVDELFAGGNPHRITSRAEAVSIAHSILHRLTKAA